MCYSRLQLPYLVFRRRFCGTATTCSVSPNGKRNSEKENVIVISGPTGAGKSRIALELAKGLNGKIISADSFEVQYHFHIRPYFNLCTEALMLDQPGHQQLIERYMKHTDLDYDFLCFFLSSPRVDLYRSIDFRCEDMLSGAEGVLSEARWLLDLGLLPNTSSDTRAIGDRQAMEYLLNVVDKWV
ncbi:hypothetical protein Bca4012_017276 [Brassica carinata]